jgi:hypothetical protein
MKYKFPEFQTDLVFAAQLDLSFDKTTTQQYGRTYCQKLESVFALICVIAIEPVDQIVNTLPYALKIETSGTKFQHRGQPRS